MDCWDGNFGEPVIYHGLKKGVTMTKKILFKEVIRDAILPYAFYASDYPLILSFEDHCSPKQQDKMARHMQTILKEYLYVGEVDETSGCLPSPEELKRKILVKHKKRQPEDDCDEYDDYLLNSDSEAIETDDKKKKKIVSKEMSAIVNYVEAVKFPGFDEPGKFYHISSLAETPATQIVEQSDSAKKLLIMNSMQLTKVYPSQKRQDSSNLNPLPFWNAGCQIVTLNYQKPDKANLYNRGLFRDNGGCGYILKPAFMREGGQMLRYSPTSPSSLPPTRNPPWRVEVTVLAGQHLPRPKKHTERKIDPFVKMKIAGHADDDGLSAKTGTVRDNGFNPVWHDEFGDGNTFLGDIAVPQLAHLMLEVKDNSRQGKERKIGAFSCPVTNLNQGYRRVPLEAYDGSSLYPAALYVHIRIIPHSIGSAVTVSDNARARLSNNCKEMSFSKV